MARLLLCGSGLAVAYLLLRRQTARQASQFTQAVVRLRRLSTPQWKSELYACGA
jgi:hypothetical protein